MRRPRLAVTVALLALVTIGVVATRADAAPVLKVSTAKARVHREDPKATFGRCERVSRTHLRCSVVAYVEAEYEEVDPTTGVVTASGEGEPLVGIPLLADVFPHVVQWSFDR